MLGAVSQQRCVLALSPRLSVAGIKGAGGRGKGRANVIFSSHAEATVETAGADPHILQDLEGGWVNWEKERERKREVEKQRKRKKERGGGEKEGTSTRRLFVRTLCVCVCVCGL